LCTWSLLILDGIQAYVCIHTHMPAHIKTHTYACTSSRGYYISKGGAIRPCLAWTTMMLATFSASIAARCSAVCHGRRSFARAGARSPGGSHGGVRPEGIGRCTAALARSASTPRRVFVTHRDTPSGQGPGCAIGGDRAMHGSSNLSLGLPSVGHPAQPRGRAYTSG
jgi:hypothetical protein